MNDLMDICKDDEIVQSIPELYTEQQFKAVDAHITRFFGECSTVFHELHSPDIHCDIYVVPHKDEQYSEYVTLITHGSGAHVMNVPSEFASAGFKRAEYMISLPAQWNVKSFNEADFWPIRLLKVLSRLPIKEDAWLGPYHTVGLTDDFAAGTGFKGVILLPALALRNNDDWPKAGICKLPYDEDNVNFYQVIPLYENELNYALEHGSVALLKCFGSDLSYVVDKSRASCVAKYKRFSKAQVTKKAPKAKAPKAPSQKFG